MLRTWSTEHLILENGGDVVVAGLEEEKRREKSEKKYTHSSARGARMTFLAFSVGPHCRPLSSSWTSQSPGFPGLRNRQGFRGIGGRRKTDDGRTIVPFRLLFAPEGRGGGCVAVPDELVEPPLAIFSL